MNQTTLFPVNFFKGETVTKEDVPRLETLLRRVERLMADGHWRTLSQIHLATLPGTEASCSARLRQLRSMGKTVERKQIGPGLWSYRVKH